MHAQTHYPIIESIKMKNTNIIDSIRVDIKYLLIVHIICYIYAEINKNQ